MKMRSRFAVGLVVVAAVVGLAGCGELFAPEPTITGMTTGGVTTLPAGDTLYVTVRGNTIGSGYSAFDDYTGTLTFTGTGVSATPVEGPGPTRTLGSTSRCPSS